MTTSPMATPSFTLESLTMMRWAFVMLVSGMVATAPATLTAPPFPCSTRTYRTTAGYDLGLRTTIHGYGVSEGHYHCVVVSCSAASAFNTNVTGQWQIDIASKGSVHLPRDSTTRHRRAAAAEPAACVDYHLPQSRLCVASDPT